MLNVIGYDLFECWLYNVEMKYSSDHEARSIMRLLKQSGLTPKSDNIMSVHLNAIYMMEAILSQWTLHNTFFMEKLKIQWWRNKLVLLIDQEFKRFFWWQMCTVLTWNVKKRVVCEILLPPTCGIIGPVDPESTWVHSSYQWPGVILCLQIYYLVIESEAVMKVMVWV